MRGNIEYGRADGHILELDAFLPAGRGPFPAVIVVHGGGWVGGDRRRNVEPLFRPVVEGGFACFTISYRLAKHPALLGAAIDDVVQAVRYVRGSAAQFDVDAGRIALLGESAGGQLAAMAALGAAGSALKAVVTLYAPSNLEQLARSPLIPQQFRQAVVGTPFEGAFLSRMRELSPVHLVRAGMPPFLLIHGTADPVVPFDQSRAMCKAIRSAGCECDLLAVNNGGHGVRGWDDAGLTSYKTLMIKWLDKRINSGI